MTQPEYTIMTAFCSKKMRFRTIPERSLDSMISTAIKKLDDDPRFLSRGACLGTYALPSGNVLEVYEDSGTQIGYMFLSLDIWLSYPNRLLVD